MAVNSMQRTLAVLKEQNLPYWIVERFNRFAGKFGQRVDLFNIIDILVIGEKNLIGIQACGSDFASHDRKILENEYAPKWLKAGGKIQLWGWRKIKKVRGKKATEWKVRLKDYNLNDFDGQGIS